MLRGSANTTKKHEQHATYSDDDDGEDDDDGDGDDDNDGYA